MKKIWILEGYITRERLEECLEEAKAMKAKLPENSEHIETANELIRIHENSIEKYPNGYWLGYQGKINYNDFCYEAKRTMKNLKDRKMKWRVLKAEIPEDAKYWVNQYVNGIENDGVLRYLYATMKYV